jgi:hypothetical protein
MQANRHLINSLRDLEHACEELIRLEPRFGDLQAATARPGCAPGQAGLKGLHGL